MKKEKHAKKHCLIHTISLVIICLLLAVVSPGKNKKNYYHININNIKMGNKFKSVDIKNRTYYFFDDMININNFDPNKIKIDKKSQKIFLFIILDM